MVALLWLSCTQGSDTSDRVLHADALVAEPAQAAALCPQIDDAQLRADCSWATVPRLVSESPELAEELCEGLEGSHADECWFLFAETTGDAVRCDRAGTMELDCRMHLVAARFAERWPRGTTIGGDEGQAAKIIDEVGLELDDDRPWSAWYRMLHNHARPLDRSACLAVQNPMRREVCQSTTIPLLHDRLNFGRDHGMALCEGDLPDSLAFAPDPVLDAILEERREDDLCDPDAVRPPPPGGVR